jgi:hypothetical protein
MAKRVRQAVGGSTFAAECDQIRMSNTIIRNAVAIIIDGTPGPQALLALAGKIAVESSHITESITQLERIGEAAKSQRTR